MSLATRLKGKGSNGFGAGSTAEQVTEGLDLSGKHYLITGCGSGLGAETARVLSRRGAHIVGLARSTENAVAALAESGAKGTPVACDLSEPASVRAAVDAVKALPFKLDGMICNAGIMALPKPVVKHGVELQFLVNYVGHFILVTGLLERLTEKGRVVVLSSSAHQMAPSGGIDYDNLDASKRYNGWKAYGRSKLADLLFAKALARRFEGSDKTAYAVHPGVIHTNLGRHMNPVMGTLFGALRPIFLKTAAQGAATQCYVATHPEAVRDSGRYFADCNPAKTSRDGDDDAAAERLWAETEKMIARFA